MEILAESCGASRRFGAFTAVAATDLTVGPGEIVGLLGGNGAGKTTLIRMLLGLLLPSGGSVLLFGSPPAIQGRRRIGYVPQTLGLYSGLTVQENWTFTASAFRLDRAPLPGTIAAWQDELVGRLPLGVQRQVAFAVALSHHPELLILDEPTSGVGPLGRARLWEEIRGAADRGAGVLATTHDMEEAGQCDRLVIMTAGHVAARGTASQITGDRTVTQIRCDDPRRAFVLLDDSDIPVRAEGQTLRASAPPAAITGLLSQAGIAATITSVPADLEEAFAAIITGQAA
jgi:ABC-2 type transport system ATP-binding protein